MNKKPGFEMKLGSEGLLYLIIILLLFAFIFFMPDIHKLISKIKLNVFFKDDNTPIVEPNDQVDNQIDIDEDETLICKKTDSKVEGNFIDTYTFYYKNNELLRIINNKNYDAITDEYLNQINTAYSVYERMNQAYNNVPGFSYNSTFESRTLDANFSYNFAMLEQDELRNDDKDLNINLYVSSSQGLDEVKSIYENMGFNCR